MWHLRVEAAPRPSILRRDRPYAGPHAACGVADVIRLVAIARRSLKGPLALEIEGPGDPLASPETVLRALALLHEHHPDVMTGLVVDGPLMAEYVEELAAFGLRYVVVRTDAATRRTARRLVDGALHRGERLDRDAAGDLLLEETPRAIALARRHGIAPIARITLLPTLNAGEVGLIAARALAQGAARVEVVPHVPVPGSPLARAGVPTPQELADARRAIADAWAAAGPRPPEPEVLGWLDPDRLVPVDVDALDAADVLSVLPDPRRRTSPAPVLPPRRAQIVAVATSDGTLVDTPLAACHLLRVYAVTADTIRCLGSRALPLDPRRRVDGVGTAQPFLRALVGCQALVATRIPKRAATLLQAVGVAPVARGGPLEDVLDRVARGTVHHAEAEAVP